MKFWRSSLVRRRSTDNGLILVPFQGMKWPELSLRGRVFLAMLVLVLVSFGATGVMSILHFKEEAEKYHTERLLRKEGAIEAHISHELERRFPGGEIAADSVSRALNDEVCHIATIHNMELGLYSLTGEMMVNSNQRWVEEGILPARLTAEMLKQRFSNQWSTWATDSGNVMLQIAQIENSTGEPMAILALPYVSKNSMPLEDIRFYKALLLLHIALFFGATYLSYVLSSTITKGFEAISEALRTANKQGTRPRIHWERQDEIGQLIAEYNRMTDLLDEQARKQAQWEREQAWREMARQVAHEVKNPLTPMRLMVQMMASQPDKQSPESIKEFSEAMLTQMDAMSQVASDFSQFATFGAHHLQTCLLVPLLERARHAFPEVTRLYALDSPWQVRVDELQFLRVLNNLLNNAFESLKPNQKASIALGARRALGGVEVWVKDNGCGISQERMKEVFEPHFTTKNSGTGLGLAITKGLIEGFSGRIWMESTEKVGTTVTIWIPEMIA